MPLFLEAALFLTASKNWSLEVALFPAAFKNRFLAASKNRSCIVNSNFSNDLEWRNNKNKSCRSQKVMQHVVDNFFIWNHLSNKNYVWFLKFKIHFFQTTSDGETPKTKVVDLENLCNFVVVDVFNWNHLFMENYSWISSHLKFKFFTWPRMEKWPKSKL